ncbi:MAG: hypothetical protein ACTS6O_01895, partial [Giesbergeria sp.]
DTDSGVAFSLVPFSWRRKRKVLRRRAHIPAPALGKGTQSLQGAGFTWLSKPGVDRWKVMFIHFYGIWINIAIP